jgi:hypothetical protein
VDSGDAVTDRKDGSDFRGVRDRGETRELLLENFGDFFGSNFHWGFFDCSWG